MLLYDQEKDNSPVDTAKAILGQSLSPVDGYDNIFCWNLEDNFLVVLHVATERSPDNNCDFDGYIVELLRRLGDTTVRLWFEEQELLPTYIKEYRSNHGVKYNVIHNLGLEQIPGLMKDSHWRIQRAKGILYSYISALQANKSHVWFSEKLVKVAPEDILRKVFSSLIYAWNLLVEGLS